MASDIVPIRPGLKIHNRDHSELIHLFEQLSLKKQEKVRDILQQLVDMESKNRPPLPAVEASSPSSPRAFLLEESRNKFLHCVMIGTRTKLHKGGLVLVPNGEMAGMAPGARTLRVALSGNRFILDSNADFRERAPDETVIAVATGCYTRI